MKMSLWAVLIGKTKDGYVPYVAYGDAHGKFLAVFTSKKEATAFLSGLNQGQDKKNKGYIRQFVTVED